MSSVVTSSTGQIQTYTTLSTTLIDLNSGEDVSKIVNWRPSGRTQNRKHSSNMPTYFQMLFIKTFLILNLLFLPYYSSAMHTRHQHKTYYCTMCEREGEKNAPFIKYLYILMAHFFFLLLTVCLCRFRYLSSGAV